MQYLWDHLSQPDPRGARWIVYKGRDELKNLYETGFVDTDHHSLSDWINAFQDSLQSDGSYRLSERQWLEKRKYRYDGPVEKPFDPMSLREGEWEGSDLEKILKEKIAPALSVDLKQFEKSLEKGRKSLASGKISVTPAIKTGLKRLLELYPSPRRMREIGVHRSQKPVPSPPNSPPPIPSSTAFTREEAASKKAVDQLSKLLWKGK